MIADNHSAHESKETQEYLHRADVMARLTVLFLPRASPDYNPIELLWHIIKQAVSYNHYYATFDEFYDTLVRNVRKFKSASGELPNLWKNRPTTSPIEVNRMEKYFCRAKNIEMSLLVSFKYNIKFDLIFIIFCKGSSSPSSLKYFVIL